MSSRLTIGIFVGGQGTRMGGVAKGLLRVPDGTETLIDRLLRQCARAAPEAAVCLVGQSTAYATLGLPQLQDDPVGVGPLGGLRALLLRASAHQSDLALALACDLPFLDEAVISALILPLSGAARVPFVDGRLQPLAAAYAPAATLSAVDGSLALGKHALMNVLDQLGPQLERLEFSDERAHALRDWDTPEDMGG
ncbi:MAG TPA: NTP transferase domain-containing protein [Polyangiaceae bacterium]